MGKHLKYETKLISHRSPGVDGKAPKYETKLWNKLVCHLHLCLTCHFREGNCSLRMERSKHHSFIQNNVQINKSVNYRPVSLTSVICKVLESIIIDHMVNFLGKFKLINPSQNGFLKARYFPAKYENVQMTLNFLEILREMGMNNNSMDKLIRWSEKWQMLFNCDKCKCLHAGHGNTGMNYETGGTILCKTVKEKELV